MVDLNRMKTEDPPPLPQMRFEMSAGILFDGNSSRVARLMRWSSADLFESLRPGDVVIAVNENDNFTIQDVGSIRKRCDPGVIDFFEAGLSLTVLSEGQTKKEVSLLLTPLRQLQIKDQLWKVHQSLQSMHRDKGASIGITLTRCEDMQYKVEKILENSPASFCHEIHQNDIIQSIDGQDITGKSKTEIDRLERGKPGTMCSIVLLSAINTNPVTVHIPRVRMSDYEHDRIVKEMADLTEVAERERISFLANFQRQMRNWKDACALWLNNERRHVELNREYASRRRDRRISITEQIRIEMAVVQKRRLIETENLNFIWHLWNKHSRYKSQQRITRYHIQNKIRLKGNWAVFRFWSDHTLNVRCSAQQRICRALWNFAPMLQQGHRLIETNVTRCWHCESLCRRLDARVRDQTRINSNAVKYLFSKTVKANSFHEWRKHFLTSKGKSSAKARFFSNKRSKLSITFLLHWGMRTVQIKTTMRLMERDLRRQNFEICKRLLLHWFLYLKGKRQLVRYAVKLLTNRHDRLTTQAFTRLRVFAKRCNAITASIPRNASILDAEVLSLRIFNNQRLRSQKGLSRMLIQTVFVSWKQRLNCAKFCIRFRERLKLQSEKRMARFVFSFISKYASKQRHRTDAMLHLIHRRVHVQLFIIVHKWLKLASQRKNVIVFAVQRGFMPMERKSSFAVSQCEWQMHIRLVFGFYSWRKKAIIRRLYQARFSMMHRSNVVPSSPSKWINDGRVIET